MKTTTKGLVRFKDWSCKLHRGSYDGGQTALWLTDSFTKEPIAKCTVNLPGDNIAPDEVAIKDYSENEGMVDALVAAGVVYIPHRQISIGFVTIPVCQLVKTEETKEEKNSCE